MYISILSNMSVQCFVPCVQNVFLHRSDFFASSCSPSECLFKLIISQSVQTSGIFHNFWSKFPGPSFPQKLHKNSHCDAGASPKSHIFTPRKFSETLKVSGGHVCCDSEYWTSCLIAACWVWTPRPNRTSFSQPRPMKREVFVWFLQQR